MNILVIAGSPKGETSVTRQYVNYLSKQFREHDWNIIDVAYAIRKFENSPTAFAEVVEQARRADFVLWAFPVYIMLVPAGYKRFIELVHERGGASAFAGKYAASLSTSIHFHDNCAHDYIRAVSEDLNMRFLGAHSPEMHDLLEESGRRQLVAFGRDIFQCASGGSEPQRRFSPLPAAGRDYRPAAVKAAISLQGRRLVILHDGATEQDNLQRMIERLRGGLSGDIATVNLRDLDIKGNCLGCLRCAAENRCAYEGKDGFIAFYENVLKRADILVFAGAVVDRHLSSLWRRFFERSFYNTHRPSFAGRQIAFLIAGPVSRLANLQEVLSGYAQWQEANLVDILSDEEENPLLLDRQIDSLASRLVNASVEGCMRPLDFHGVGGRKIFRDHIYGPLRPVFIADHRYYARTGYYDFPTRDWGRRSLHAVLGFLFRIGWLRRSFEKRMKKGMVQPFLRWSAGS
jgi:multimeric flavodoxin WrbA